MIITNEIQKYINGHITYANIRYGCIKIIAAFKVGMTSLKCYSTYKILRKSSYTFARLFI